jgi:hypothetical protein
MRRETVLSIDRATSTVRATNIGSAGYGDEPPPPTSRALFEQVEGGDWTCLRMDSHRRRITREDWLKAVNESAGVVQSGETWFYEENNAFCALLQRGVTHKRPGAASIFLPATVDTRVFLSADDLNFCPPDTPIEGALWYSADILFTSVTSIMGGVGLANANRWQLGAGAANDRQARVHLDTNVSGNFIFQCYNNTGVTAADASVAVEANTWYSIDIVVMVGQWAAAWVNGFGPTLIDTNVPASGGNGMQPGWMAYNRSAAEKELVCDWINLDVFHAATKPTE